MRSRIVTGLVGITAAMAASALVAPLVKAQQGKAATTALSSAGNAATAERVATLLERRYVVPATGRLYGAMLRQRVASGAYAGFTDPAALGERMTADLQAVSPDGHLRVRAPRARQQPAGEAAVAPETEVAPGVAEARWLEPGVAYLRFTRFSDDPAAVAAVTDFLRSHADAKALVIDARGHHGGTQPLLAVFGNYLFGSERHLVDMDMSAAVVAEQGTPFPVDGKVMRRAAAPAGLVRFQHWSVPATDAPALFRTPVYYLTSHHTFSAAEHMAFMLKRTGRATLIGETTGGGNHFGGTEEVGSGLEMFVPIGRTSDPVTGRDWEKVGVEPDVAVPQARALDEALARIHAAKS